MIKRAFFKLLEVVAISVFAVGILLVMSDGVSQDLQAGTTADGDPCSAMELAGDFNGDDVISILDALNTLQYLFAGGDPPVPICNAGSQFDDDVVEKINDFFSYVSIVDVEDPNDSDIVYPTLLFTECNLQLVNGLDATNGDPDDPTAWASADDITANGLGNLVIGYNELRDDVDDPDARDGSHNLILGIQQQYSSVGGLLAGRKNEATAPYVLLAAYSNHALARATTVIGGCKNTASGQFASVMGGRKNVASGGWSVVAGGGGRADDGSEGNVAAGDYSTVSGGRSRDCDGEADWAAGSLFEED